MQRYEYAVDIDAPASAVWEIWSKPSLAAEWSPTFRSFEALDGDTLAAGNRFRIDVKGGRDSTWTVTEVKDGASFAWSMAATGVRAVADHIVTARSGGKSRVTLRVDFGGPLAPIVRPMLARVARQNLVEEANGLKRRAEAVPV
ncbi:MAG: SRPBCC family protein [Dehalococcoidia bacterium]